MSAKQEPSADYCSRPQREEQIEHDEAHDHEPDDDPEDGLLRACSRKRHVPKGSTKARFGPRLGRLCRAGEACGPNRDSEARHVWKTEARSLQGGTCSPSANA